MSPLQCKTFEHFISNVNELIVICYILSGSLVGDDSWGSPWLFRRETQETNEGQEGKETSGETAWSCEVLGAFQQGGERENTWYTSRSDQPTLPSCLPIWKIEHQIIRCSSRAKPFKVFTCKLQFMDCLLVVSTLVLTSTPTLTLNFSSLTSTLTSAL